MTISDLPLSKKSLAGSILGAALVVAALGFGLTLSPQSASAQGLDPTLQKIKDSNTLVIGHRTNAVPFSFVVSEETGLDYGKAGEIMGYTIDLCLAVAEDLKQELDLPDLRIEYRRITLSNRIEAVQNGEVDILCGATAHTLERRKRVDFSLQTFASGTELLVNEDLATYTSGFDLSGRRIGLRKETVTYEHARAAIERLKIPDVEIVFFENHNAGLAALEDKEISAYLAARIELVFLLDRARDPDRLTLLNRLISYEPLALAVRRDSPDFLLTVDSTLAELYRSRKILETFDKWFGDMGALSNEMMIRAIYNLQSIPKGG